MYTGLTGKVKIGKSESKAVAYISNWSIEDTTDIIEITQLGSNFKHKKAGLQSWSASAEGAVEFAGDDGHKELFEAKHKGEKVCVELYLNYEKPVQPVEGQTPTEKYGTYFKGYGYIESLSVDLSAEDKGNISISINGSGELLLYPGTATPVGNTENLDSEE